MKIRTTYTIELDRRVAELLAVLDEQGDVQNVIERLIDHAQQGVYRPYAWERDWLKQVFVDDWLHRLQSGDPYERGGGEDVYQKPKKRGYLEDSE
jgi:hypothetical protein